MEARTLAEAETVSTGDHGAAAGSWYARKAVGNIALGHFVQLDKACIILGNKVLHPVDVNVQEKAILGEQ
eukprot:5781705-Karenia_brevis.AAC.1